MKRLDVIIAEHQNISRSKAKEMIVNGWVSIQNQVITKPSFLVEGFDAVALHLPDTLYVSRGGQKLEHALSVFQLTVTDKTCMDIGASTGGFTDCLLQHGAKLVYAIDVGTNQLHPSLQNHPQIISLENTNIRTTPDLPQTELIVIDVSFISLTLVLPIVYDLLAQGGICLPLIKPQFEVGAKHLNKQGVVKDKKIVDRCLKNIEQHVTALGFHFSGKTISPITGKNGNTEYFFALRKE